MMALGFDPGTMWVQVLPGSQGDSMFIYIAQASGPALSALHKTTRYLDHNTWYCSGRGQWTEDLGEAKPYRKSGHAAAAAKYVYTYHIRDVPWERDQEYFVMKYILTEAEVIPGKTKKKSTK